MLVANPFSVRPNDLFSSKTQAGEDGLHMGSKAHMECYGQRSPSQLDVSSPELLFRYHVIGVSERERIGDDKLEQLYKIYPVDA
jgi:hypothetical protein